MIVMPINKTVSQLRMLFDVFTKHSSLIELWAYPRPCLNYKTGLLSYLWLYWYHRDPKPN